MILASLFMTGCLTKTEKFQFEITADLSQEEPKNEDTESDIEEVQDRGSTESDVSDPEGQADITDSGICEDAISGTDIGDCATNFTLLDRNQESVQLHDFYGQVIFLDLSSFS